MSVQNRRKKKGPRNGQSRNTIRQRRNQRNMNDESNHNITERKGLIMNAGIPRPMSPRYVYAQLDGNVVSSWTIVDITPIFPGSGDTNRTGRYVRLQDIHLLFSVNAQNADIFTNTRIVLFQWVPQSFNQPVNMGSVFETNNYIYSPYNVDAAESYTILWDTFAAQSGTGSNPTPSGNLVYNKLFTRGFHRDQLYGAVTAGSFHKIYFAYLSNSALIPFPALSGVSTVRFNT
jgi:hypothetical protein